jgi:hypothetical protein
MNRPHGNPATWVSVGTAWAIAVLGLLAILQRAGASPMEQVGAVIFLLPALVFAD